MNKLLIISGPTATGKTALALKLAQKFNGELVSADSRQVYRGMDIGTGKDIENFEFRISNLSWCNKKLGFYQSGQARIWGYDLVEPNQNFSLANFLKFAQLIIPDICSRGALPIIVSGTGLYLNALINPPASVTIKPDAKLRDKLSTLSLSELQRELQTVNPQKFSSMNHSDQNNPRRLIRAIEIAGWQPTKTAPKIDFSTANHLWLNLTGPIDFIDQQIEARVHQRLDRGFPQEIDRLIKSGFDQTFPAATATGYRQWLAYLSGQITNQEAVSQWTSAERQYARRQLTWFNKSPVDHTINITIANWQQQVALLVEDWYSKS